MLQPYKGIDPLKGYLIKQKTFMPPLPIEKLDRIKTNLADSLQTNVKSIKEVLKTRGIK